MFNELIPVVFTLPLFIIFSFSKKTPTTYIIMIKSLR